MKKAVQLSLNFLVTIIIAIAIFVFGVRFISDLAVETSKLESFTTEQLDKRTQNLVCDQTEKVCIPITKKTIQKGNFDVFGIRITNILDTTEFDINVKVSKLITKGNDEITDATVLDKIKLKHRQKVIVEKNNEENIGLGIGVAKNAFSGTYILDVKISQYDEMYKVYVEVA
jgi:hypothetical protein|tara:strand:- start:2261 stop:2776 length:516 start_codon:yes stop_codon:yes gene_type:complete